jgi:hypothetical protein
MKQTAVEWLHEQLLKILIDNQIQQTDYLFEQAKAMEKEQIKGSWNHGFDWGMMEQSLAEQGAESTLIDAEHYYLETYGGQDEL